MTSADTVRQLFDIPERVHQGDYVLKLTEGLQNPEETAGLYVTTPKLVDAFDRALGLVGDALRSGQSKASYLHGSFGSGKSHFMAMLSSAKRLPATIYELRFKKVRQRTRLRFSKPLRRWQSKGDRMKAMPWLSLKEPGLVGYRSSTGVCLRFSCCG